jgi:Reverse transcriptase (RNA-dependent DNA polymerase)
VHGKWIIEKPASMETYQTNLLPVPKPSSDLGYRITQNLAPMNPYIVPDTYPIPFMDDVLHAKSHRYCRFSEIDVESAFNQLPLDENSQALTGFTWRGVHYVWIRLVQGLITAPACFQRVMDKLMSVVQIEGSVVFVYFDNILIMSESDDS